MPGAFALAADASEQEDDFPQVIHPQPAGAEPFDTGSHKGEGRGRKLVTEHSTPVGSGRFSDHAQDPRGVLGMSCSSIKNPLNYFQMLLTVDIHHLIGSTPLNRCCL